MKAQFDDYDEKLRKRLEAEMREIDLELEKHPELAGLEPSSSADQEMMDRIQRFQEASQAREEEYIPKEWAKSGRKVVKGHFRMSSRVWKRVVAAVVAVAIMSGVGMTSMGGPERVVSFLSVIMREKQGSKVTSTRRISKESMGVKDVDAYQEIVEELGVAPVFLSIKQKGVRFKEYRIDKELGTAYVIYDYKGNNINLSINCSYGEDAYGIVREEYMVDQYSVPLKLVEAKVSEYELNNGAEYQYIAEFEYQDVFYQLTGNVEKEVFEEILKNLFFP